MLVKARWSVKDRSGWHDAGEVFHTESELGDAVIVLDAPAKAEKQPVKAPAEPVEAEEQQKTETAEKPVKKRNTARRTTGR